VLYLVTGVVGSVGSYVFNPEATSAGASGAIFGLFGVMAMFAFKYRKEIPKTLSRDIMRRVLPIIAINLAFGFSVKIVDNAAHIGGLLAGIALALAVPYMRPDENRTPLAWRAVQATCLVLVVVSFVSAFRNYNGPQLAFSNLTSRPGSSVVAFSDRIEKGDRLLVESFRSVDAALRNSDAAVEVEAARDSVERGISAVMSAPAVDAESDKYRARLLGLLNQQKDILTEFAQSTAKDRASLRRDEEALIVQHNRFVSDYGEWWPGFLKEHGYRPADGGEQ
jgi:hypothetical protein